MVAGVLGFSLGFVPMVLVYWRSQKRWLLAASQLEKQRWQLEAQNLTLKESQSLWGQQMKDIKEKLLVEMQASHQRVMQQTGEHLQRTTSVGLESILKPFQAQIHHFEEKVLRSVDLEARERVSLKKEIEMMAESHRTMTKETSSLTKALKGDMRIQGEWGEITLRRLLESSGLREGSEFEVQGRGRFFRTEQGELRKPDYLILLPEDRNILIDCKVSLDSFARFLQVEDDDLKRRAGQDFLAALWRHVEDLSKKDYPALFDGGMAPDFVFLFLPNDGAFTLAAQLDSELFQRAWAKRVVVTCPSLLFPNLRTIEGLWRQDAQNRNALEIARLGGQLVDKFILLLEDIQKSKTQIESSLGSLDSAILRMKNGRGNLLSQVQRLEKLGARGRKKWPKLSEADLPEDSDLDTPSDPIDRDLFSTKEIEPLPGNATN